MPSSYLARAAQYQQYVGSAAVLLATLALAMPAVAHDFWIEPAKFRASTDDKKIPLRLYTGEEFRGNASIYNPADFERYVYAGPAGVQPIPGELGDDPAGHLPVNGTGTYVVGFQSKRHEAKFSTPAEFEQYLKTERIGVEKLMQVLERANRNVLEIYTRCAKALVLAGPVSKTVDHVLGFPLELVALTSPHGNDPALDVRLLYRGKPLEGANLIAFTKQQPEDKVRAQTDKDGHATLKLTGPGVWLVSTVHAFPLPSLARADFESYWASLTFERAAR